MTFDENAVTCLEDLKFKAEDSDCYESEGKIYSSVAGLPNPGTLITLERANRILAEKLTPLLTELHELRKLKEEVERAPEVFGTTVGVLEGEGIKWSHSHWVNLHRVDSPNCDTHKARLVCIKPIKE